MRAGRARSSCSNWTNSVKPEMRTIYVKTLNYIHTKFHYDQEETLGDTYAYFRGDLLLLNCLWPVATGWESGTCSIDSGTCRVFNMPQHRTLSSSEYKVLYYFMSYAINTLLGFCWWKSIFLNILGLSTLGSNPGPWVRQARILQLDHPTAFSYTKNELVS